MTHHLNGTLVLLATLSSMAPLFSAEQSFVSREFTAPKTFTGGIEGPAVDRDGNIYAVNYQRQHTIGKVTPAGKASVLVELPAGSVGNGIRFDRRGQMFIADYVNHNVLKVDMKTRKVSVHAHEPKMNQPNDLAIGWNDILYASDPNWGKSTGQIWRIDTDGKVTLLDDKMGTTNGIEVSPGDKILYVNESLQRKVWAYDLSPTGEVSNKRLLIEFEDFGMDGMRCDAKGNLYITRHQKATIAIVSPEGKLLHEVKLAGKNPTNITFGGPDGRNCYVTLADRGNIEVFRSEIPGRGWKMIAFAAEGPNWHKGLPRLHNSRWLLHDLNRPQPTVVTPGARLQRPPSDAVVLFDGTDLAAWQGTDGPAKWVVKNGFMELNGTRDIKTRESFGDCQLHIEWTNPSPPEQISQARGNGGIFFMDLYEIQIVDSYSNATYADGAAASIYGQHPPLVNSCRPPGQWQTYDIVFRAPRFNNAALTEPGRVTVFHNGVLVQHNAEVYGRTAYRTLAQYAPHGPTGPIRLQDHGDDQAMRFRNIWIRRLDLSGDD